MHKQTQIIYLRHDPSLKTTSENQTEHRFYAEIKKDRTKNIKTMITFVYFFYSRITPISFKKR
jgi:hypothetical protein